MLRGHDRRRPGRRFSDRRPLVSGPVRRRPRKIVVPGMGPPGIGSPLPPPERRVLFVPNASQVIFTHRAANGDQLHSLNDGSTTFGDATRPRYDPFNKILYYTRNGEIFAFDRLPTDALSLRWRITVPAVDPAWVEAASDGFYATWREASDGVRHYAKYDIDGDEIWKKTHTVGTTFATGALTYIAAYDLLYIVGGTGTPLWSYAGSTGDPVANFGTVGGNSVQLASTAKWVVLASTTAPTGFQRFHPTTMVAQPRVQTSTNVGSGNVYIDLMPDGRLVWAGPSAFGAWRVYDEDDDLIASAAINMGSGGQSLDPEGILYVARNEARIRAYDLGLNEVLNREVLNARRGIATEAGKPGAFPEWWA